MSNRVALSGIRHTPTNEIAQPQENNERTQGMQGMQEVAAQRELAAFLDVADQAESSEELQTLTDKLFSNDNKANSSEKGTLTAESILNNSALSPTGTQVINTLSVDARTIAQFEGLRNFEISFLFRRLATFVPALQETYGRKLTTFADGNEMPCEYNGYYGLLDPLMLASYVPYAEVIEDLRDSQIEECFHGFSLIDGYECFHGFSLIDGYPTIQGKPLWERQEWERVDYYNLFKLYRDMRYAFYNDVDALYVSRSLAVLAKAVNLAASTVNYLAQVYGWGLRAAMYDTWMVTMQQRRQAVKRNLMLDRHTKIAQALTAKAFEALKKQADKMSPKEAIQLLELGLKYERISAGMSGDKPEVTGGQPLSSGPLLSIVNQTNNSAGPMQINHVSNASQRLQDDMKKPDTLLSILSVLQRSGALNTALNGAPGDEEVEEVEAEIVMDGELVEMEAIEVELSSK